MKKYLPFTLTAIIIAIDQITKALVVAFIPENTMWKSFFSDFLEIIHVRNNAVAFSMGSGFPMILKIVLFIVVPLVFLGMLAYYLVRAKDEDVTVFQRWLMAGIVGGGIGNVIDRIFRGMSVVDFISTNNYGVFGMERFPTYNIADASVVICVILMVITIIFPSRDSKEKKK